MQISDATVHILLSFAREHNFLMPHLNHPGETTNMRSLSATVIGLLIIAQNTTALRQRYPTKSTPTRAYQWMPILTLNGDGATLTHMAAAKLCDFVRRNIPRNLDELIRASRAVWAGSRCPR